MPEFDSERFKECWKKTEVLREYQRTLYTFGDMELFYVFAAEHARLKDRTVVNRGVIIFQRPQIILPPYYSGFEFRDGFEHADAMPPEAAYLLRCMRLPYCHVNNRSIVKEELEYGSLGEVLDRFDKKLEREDDTETGLIKGLIDGADVSLMRYSLGLVIKSAPGNLKEFFEHLKRQRGEPIRPDERITDEDIRKLFDSRF